MHQESAPGPFETDYYAGNWYESSVRGGVFVHHSSAAIDSVSSPLDHIAKIPQLFSNSTCKAPPPKPVDPCYVFPRSHFSVGSVTSVADLGNSILFVLQSLCPLGTEFRTDPDRVKISVLIPGTLDFKVKLFGTNNSEEFLVAVRRDSGDWFVFIQLYSAIKKKLVRQQHNSGMRVGV